MKNRVPFVTRIVMTFSIICFVFSGISQSVDPPKIETPNVAGLEKFGDVPVDLSTGIPNISIPIHTLHYGNINVPISLRYHPGALRVAQHEGWVGLGWDLESGGAITRKVNWWPDEYYGPNINGSSRPYYNIPSTPVTTSGSEIVNSNDNWNTVTSLKNYFSVNTTIQFGADYCADEFSFNFMGYTGKFYYEGPSKGWVVSSDQNVKVELTYSAAPFLSGSSVLGTINNEYPISGTIGTSGHVNHSVINALDGWTTQVFAGFTLTVPDGTKYYFGSVNGTIGSGIEFYSQYSALGVGQMIGANTWLLTKIVDVDNNEVDFEYTADYPTADLGFGCFSVTGTCTNNTKGFLSNYGGAWENGSGIDVNSLSGTLSFPLYLNKILCNNETITFNHTSTNPNNSLRLPNTTYDIVHNTSNRFPLQILFDGSGDGSGHLIDGAANIQWEQLNNITIANGNGQVYRQYNFGYSSNPNTRLHLQNFSELDNIGTAIQKYSFDYNTAFPNSVLYTGNYSDHWGFYNGKPVNTSYITYPDNNNAAIFANKVTDPSLVLDELLKTIYYPTGGKTIFTWQPHDFSQIVAPDRQTLTASPWPSWAPSYAGGARIAEVQSYLASNVLALDHKFKYLRGYSNATGTGLTSSGILNGSPSYYLQLSARLGFNGTSIETVNASSLNSFANYSYSSQGSYIGYDEVVVIDADGSYTKNYFTSYGPDLNNVSHFDIQPTCIGWKAGDTYYPMNTLDNERGKPIGIFQYNANDVLVKKTINTYRNDPGRFNSFLRLIDFNTLYGGCGSNSTDALILATANNKFTYDYYVTKQSITQYDRLGENPITTSTTYTYNTNNLISTKTETNSKGESIQTAFTYPNDILSSDPTYATCLAMTAAHILSPVMQTIVTKNGTQLSLTKISYYSPRTGMYKQQTIQMQIGTNSLETRQQFYNYDMHGNLNELSKTNDTHDVYLWGYNGQYPVAKISGSTFSAVTAIVNQAQIDAATAIANNDVNVRVLLKTLRTGLPSALVTYYTYLPGTGITSETDARGQTTFYQYDNFQRLKAITDFNNKILKTFSYQYQIPQ